MPQSQIGSNGSMVGGKSTSNTHTTVSNEHGGSMLGPILCWAVVFADIGTSVYYVPGILYGNVHKLSGFYVFLTLAVFILLAVKYVEVTRRFPEGGGVVMVCAKAIH